VLLQLRSKVANADQLRAKAVAPDDVAVLLERDVDVFRPDGQPLVILRRASIPTDVLDGAYEALHSLRSQRGYNRGAYSGGERFYAKRADGTASKQSYVLDAEGKPINSSSAIVGFFDRQGGRSPYCRQTAFTAHETARWATVVPVARAAARLFAATSPDRYQRQLEECARCPDYVIPDTPFTTLTVNNNGAPAGIHKDAGDFKEGLGVISYLVRGTYDGGLLVFPEYRLGVDLRHGDTVFFNSHEWHGVTPMTNKSPDAERISIVLYMRHKMVECLPVQQELERARARGELTQEDA
jgi:hypothetical protein